MDNVKLLFIGVLIFKVNNIELIDEVIPSCLEQINADMYCVIGR